MVDGMLVHRNYSTDWSLFMLSSGEACEGDLKCCPVAEPPHGPPHIIYMFTAIRLIVSHLVKHNKHNKQMGPSVVHEHVKMCLFMSGSHSF